jgi:hypothetical protein
VDNHVKDMLVDIRAIVPNFQEREFFQDFEETRDSVREAIKGRATDEQIDEINEKLDELKSLYDTRAELRNRFENVVVAVGGKPFGVADDVQTIDEIIKNGFLGSQGIMGLRSDIGLSQAKELGKSIIGMKRRGFETSQELASSAREYLSDIDDAMDRLRVIQDKYEVAERADAEVAAGVNLEKQYADYNKDAERHLITLRTAFDGLATIAFNNDDLFRRFNLLALKKRKQKPYNQFSSVQSRIHQLRILNMKLTQIHFRIHHKSKWFIKESFKEN